MECSDCLLCNLPLPATQGLHNSWIFHRFCSETRCQIILDVPKTPSPSVDWETRSLDGLHIVCFWVDYLCIYVQYADISHRWAILKNEILKLSGKFKILQISSIPVSLSQDHVADVILKWLIRFGIFFWFSRLVTSLFWTSQADGQKHISHNLMMSWARFYTFFLGGISAMKPCKSSKLATVCLPQKCCEMIVLCKETSPLWIPDSFMLEIHQMDNLATIPIISIHVLLAWHSRPCLACHGSWRDASEGLQSAAWWLDSPIYRPMAKPKQGFIGWNKSLGARPIAVFLLNFGILGFVGFEWARMWSCRTWLLTKTLRCENASHFITHVLAYMTPSQYLTHPHAYQAVNTYWKR